MKTLYLTRSSSSILVDTENNTANRLETSPSNINYMWLAEEPMHVVYGFGETLLETNVDAGDIIIIFYNRGLKNQMIVVKSNEWRENIVEYRKKEQEEKERWAAEKVACEKCDNGDN